MFLYIKFIHVLGKCVRLAIESKIDLDKKDTAHFVQCTSPLLPPHLIPYSCILEAVDEQQNNLAMLFRSVEIFNFPSK